MGGLCRWPWWFCHTVRLAAAPFGASLMWVSEDFDLGRQFNYLSHPQNSLLASLAMTDSRRRDSPFRQLHGELDMGSSRSFFCECRLRRVSSPVACASQDVPTEGLSFSLVLSRFGLGLIVSTLSISCSRCVCFAFPPFTRASVPQPCRPADPVPRASAPSLRIG